MYSFCTVSIHFVCGFHTFLHFVFSIEMIPNQLFINLTDLIFVDLSDNSLGKWRALRYISTNKLYWFDFILMFSVYIIFVISQRPCLRRWEGWQIYKLWFWTTIPWSMLNSDSYLPLLPWKLFRWGTRRELLPTSHQAWTHWVIYKVR